MTASTFLKRLQMPRLNPIACVVLPTVLALLYLGLIASSQFTCQSQFIIKRSNSGNSSISLALPFLSSQISTSREDALLIQDYLHSRDLLERLDADLYLIRHFSDPQNDFWARLKAAATREDQLAYFQGKVDVQIDPESSIITLNTRAFSPDMAEAINQKVLTYAEAFINNISLSLATAQVEFVRAEVNKAEAGLTEARQASLAFQKKHNLIDPESEGASLFSRISELESQLSQKQTELKTLLSYLQEDSTRVATVKKEIAALEAQIEEETRLLAGGDQRSLNQIMADYQQLKISQEFALNTYTSALASLEAARTDAARQVQFLVTVGSTGRPEEASHPRLLRGTLTTFVLAGLLFLVGRLLIATINDHQI